MDLMCTKKENRGLTGCVACTWEHCQVLTDDEKKRVYHLEEMKDDRLED